MSIEKNEPGKQEYYFSKEWFQVDSIGDNVLAIREPNHIEDVLSYYIHSNNQAVLIDTGMGLANISAVLPSDIKPKILLTHTHWDHMGNVSEFDNINVSDSPFEEDRLRRGWKPNEMVGFEEETFVSPHFKPPINFSNEHFYLPGITNFDTVQDEQVIKVGAFTIHVLQTPGHSPGSTSYFLEELGFLFTGDTIYPGPEYLHMKESDPDEYTLSLKKLVDSVGSKLQLILPGHNAFMANPQLLFDHLAAAKGLLPPDEIRIGEDDFGQYRVSYIEKRWANFQFRLPVSK